MITTISFIILALLWALLTFLKKYDAELLINPIIGFMIGGLYNEEEGEHTVQILSGFICFTLVWYNE